MSASASLLDVTAIETFYGPIQAIRGVSLQVAQGQIVTVLGANGAGKTTVLRTVSGVLDPERVLESRVWPLLRDLRAQRATRRTGLREVRRAVRPTRWM